MNRLNFVPVTELSDAELDSAGEHIHTIVSKEKVQDMLKGRNLLGVIKRHKVSTERSAQSFRALRDTEQPQKTTVFFIEKTATPGEFIGMATAQEGLPLTHHLADLPACIGRRISWLSEVKTTPLTNVAAWTDVNDAGAYSEEDLFESYGFLRQEAPESWTLAPRYDPEFMKHQFALVRAGYTMANGIVGPHNSARYDDGESRWAPVPESYLFVTIESVKEPLDI